jgi:hypothetical protein
MKIQVMLSKNYLQHNVVCFETFQFLSYPMTIYLCKQPANFELIDLRASDSEFLVPLAPTFRFIEYI